MRQPLTAQQAEVRWRRGAGAEGIASSPDFVAFYGPQVDRTLADVEALEDAGLALGPFLEIGAGRAHRSSTLRSHLNLEGVATDLCLGWLMDGPPLAERLGLETASDRICADMESLPFGDGVFNFVFCYRSLHHLAAPHTALSEAFRALAPGGWLFFDEEPVDSPLRRALRGQRVLDEPLTRTQHAFAKLGLDKVFWDEGGPEREAGILESRFGLDRWLAALSEFELRRCSINRRLRLELGAEGRAGRLRIWLARSLGGNIRVLARKPGQVDPERLPDWRAGVVCPSCREAAFQREPGRWICGACRAHYPLIEGVPVLLDPERRQLLYPNLEAAETT